MRTIIIWTLLIATIVLILIFPPILLLIMVFCGGYGLRWNREKESGES